MIIKTDMKNKLNKIVFTVEMNLAEAKQCASLAEAENCFRLLEHASGRCTLPRGWTDELQDHFDRHHQDDANWLADGQPTSVLERN